MDRRRFLAASLGGVVGFAGCVAPRRRADASSDASTENASTTPTASPPASSAPISGIGELPVPAGELRRATPRDARPALVDPAFAGDWDGLEIDLGRGTYRPTLADDEDVIGVTRGDDARAYPLTVLGWHEVVNDRFDGPLLVTYCPICKSGVVAERRVGGQETVFGVSGLLYRENLVMYDRATESLWSQILATAINGPATGTELSLLPSTVTSWGAWKSQHPETEVLLPAPLSGTVVGEVRFNYSIDLFARWERILERQSGSGADFAPGGGQKGSQGVPARMLVVGVSAGDATVAYPLNRVEWERVVNDEVGGRPVVVAVTPGRSLVAYERRIDGETLTFAPGDSGVMTAGGSRWELTTGRAVDGPFRGRRLRQANDVSPMLWFAWRAFHPETRVYGNDE